ncbi:DUF5605 domain-containing protein [Streptomyces sp. NPDC005811]|uniref:DUF5605 domain-containing protein n=1 Tax=Streptomyces sp. NPDC005811 TaxID=3154565 RepID=UPI0033DCBF2C
MAYGPSSVLGEVLRDEQAEAVVRRHLPALDDEPGIVQLLLPAGFDFPASGVEGRYLLTCFGVAQPRLRSFRFSSGTRHRAQVIGTWNMTVTELPEVYEGTFTVPLPRRPYLAIRLRALTQN